MFVSESPPSTVQQLQAVPLFAGLGTEALESIVHLSRRRQIPAGDRFFRQGEPASALHLLVQGQVRLTQVTPDGKDASSHQNLGKRSEYQSVAQRWR
jgi:signal-transduction protein with cAMP-binding, CBS, and nucleotidyltransferase domain